MPSNGYNKWHDEQLLCLRTAGLVPPVPIDYQCFFKVVFYHKTLRRCDSDNMLSSILDLLQDAGVIKDDCWQVVSKIIIENEKANYDGAAVTISPAR